MGRPTLAESKDTRSELIQVATEMIQTRGYNAFSYQDLADRLDIKKASIHYYFPSKEDLGVSLIEASLERVKSWQAKQSPDASALDRMENYFEYFKKVSNDATRICPCGALASEWGALTPKLQDAVNQLLAAHRDWLKEVLEKGRKDGEIVKSGTTEDQAQFIFASMQGGLQISRAQGNASYFLAVTKQLLSSLKA